MADCIELTGIESILKVNLKDKRTKSVSEADAKKPYKFDTHKVTPQLFYDLMTGKEGSFKRLKDIVNNNNVVKKMFGINKLAERKNPLFADLKEPTNEQEAEEIGRRMQIRGLAMKHLLGTIKSEKDVENELGLHPEDVEKLYEGGSRKVSTIGMATALGRDIAYMMGFKPQADPAHANKLYQEIGMNALKEIEKNTGLITLSTNDYILNNKYMKNRFERVSSAQLIPGNTTVRMNYDKIVPSGKNTETQIKMINNALEEGKSVEMLATRYSYMNNIATISETAKFTNRLVVPTNLQIPSNSTPDIRQGNGITMDMESRKLIGELQGMSGGINTNIAKFFLQLNKQVQQAVENDLKNKVDSDFESILKEHFSDDLQFLNFVFGTYDTKATEETKAKAVGQSLSKTSTVKELIENAPLYFNEDGSPKPLYHQMEMYRTGRIGYMETVLNPQTDKFFSRFALDGGEYTVDVGSKAYEHLIAGISDDSGIEPTDIVHEGQNDGVDFLVDEYRKAFDPNLSQEEAFKKQKDFMKRLYGGRYKKDGKWHDLPKLKGSVWQQISSIAAVSDVRNAKKGQVTTKFMTKPDATGSGIVLQLLQMIGLKETVGSRDKLKQLKLMTPDERTEFIDDVYGFLQTSLNKFIENPITEEEDKIAQFVNDMQSLGFVKNMRDLVKPPTMITSYLAGPAAVKQTTGEAYSDAIYEVLENNRATQKQLNFVRSLIKEYDDKYGTNISEDINKINGLTGRKLAMVPGLKEALTRQIGDTVGSKMHSLINESLLSGAMKTFHKKIIDMYGSMEKIAKEQDELIAQGKLSSKDRLDPKVLPAKVVLDMALNPESDSWFKETKDKRGKKIRTKMTYDEILDTYGMPITSASQVIKKVNGENVVVMQEGMNAITSLVNVIHSMDSAILQHAHRRTIYRIKAELDSNPKPRRIKQLEHALNSAKYSIHDAVNGDAVYNAIYEEEYRNAVKDVMTHYDMFDQMAKALDSMHKRKYADAKDILSEKDLRKLKEAGEQSLKEKQKLIKEDAFDFTGGKVFGFDEVNLEPRREESSTNTEEKNSDPLMDAMFKEDTKKNSEIKHDSKGTKHSGKTRKHIEVLNKIKEIAKNSPVVKKFLQKHGIGKFDVDTFSQYNEIYDTVVLSNDAGLTSEQLQTQLEHEIAHQQTVGFIGARPNDVDVDYIKKNLDVLRKNKDKIYKRIKDENMRKRFAKFLTEENKKRALIEFVAIMAAEPDVAKALNDSLKEKAVRTRLQRLLKKIRDWALGKRNFGVDMDQVMISVQNTIKKGEAFNESNPVEAKQGRSNINKALKGKKVKYDTEPTPEMKRFLKQMNYKPYEPASVDSYRTPFVDIGIRTLNDYVGSMIASMALNKEKEFRYKDQVQKLDEIMYANFPIYAANRNRLLDYWDSNHLVQTMRGMLQPEVFGDRLTMERLMAANEIAQQKRGTTDDRLIADMNRLMAHLKEDEVEALYDVTSQAPLFHLIDGSTLLNDLVEGNISLDDVVTNLEQEVINKTGSRSKQNVVQAKRMADMLTGEENFKPTKSDAYNMDLVGVGDEIRTPMSKLVALYAMQNSKNADKAFEVLRTNEKLYHKIIDASKGLKELNKMIYDKTKDPKRYRDNLVNDIFDTEYDIQAITYDEFKEDKYKSEYGWEVLRRPTKNTYGIVYRKSKDETYQSGAGTSVSYRNTDVIVEKYKHKPNNVEVLTTDIGRKEKRHKLILTRKEKEQLGLVKNPADALYRSISRLDEIMETQASRDLLISSQFNEKFTSKHQLEKFDEMLGSMDKKDMKWMLKLPKGITTLDINQKDKTGKYKYPNIRKYYKIPERNSSVGGFRHNFDMVRKDAEPWLMGYKDIVLFENSPWGRKVAYTIRQMVKYTKIVWTALNPSKIMNDVISNTMILVGFDVPPARIASYGKTILKELKEFEDLRIQELEARVHGNEKKMKLYQKAIKNHPLNQMLQNGMMQSINIELFNRDQSVVTGLQKDIEELLNDFVLMPDGKKTMLFNAVKTMADKGDFGIESILEWMSKGAKNIKIMEQFGESLEKSQKNFEKLRTTEKDEEIARYLTEFLMTPSSQAVQLGSSLVQKADIVARGIMLRHLIDTGMSEEEAILKTTDAFINYKQNMPKELKMLSDYGVLLFPSFWMRVQRVIWSLLSHNPATALLAASTEELTQIDLPTIFDSNIVTKIDHGILNTPPILGFWE